MQLTGKNLFFTGLIFLSGFQVKAQSVAQKWMKLELEMITKDGQGPTIHARNLFHVSAAMYDAWSYFQKESKPFLMGNTIGGFESNDSIKFQLQDITKKDSLTNIAISYAAYRILWFRFNNYGSKGRTIEPLNDLFESLNLDPRLTYTSNYTTDPIALGNKIGETYNTFGYQDGSREIDQHESFFYNPVNSPMDPGKSGVQELSHVNHWQPLNLMPYIEKMGGDPILDDWNFLIATNQADFLTPEWGEVTPFSLTKKDLQIKSDGAGEFKVYLDPEEPPYLRSPTSEYYKWGFLLVALWSEHLDPSDSVYIDISPATAGSSAHLPKEYSEYKQYFHIQNGGTQTQGHKKNPYTGKPYPANVVLRGDYTRVISEYWVDGINTPGPPGHWFNHLIDASNKPEFDHKWKGKGPKLSNLEWDIKAYFTLGGAMHDAAICAWGAKGYYDYVRPITAIRFMAQKGQCSDSTLSNFHREGLPLMEGKIEIVKKRDPLSGANGENIGKIKIKCWKGPDYLDENSSEAVGVDWILGENWWPYQRYSFATPPFAGYVSGHSTFSIAGADILTSITGSAYFPGGLHQFTAKKNDFLLFEKGPSTDITLQWATYRDAANETCLSRIWGGIHPPCDDIKGRIIGEKVAIKVLDKVDTFFK